MARIKQTQATRPSQNLASRQRQEVPETNSGSYQSSGDTIADEDAPMNGVALPDGRSEGHIEESTFNIDTSSSNAIDSISSESNRLLDAINDIHMLGIENYALELPKIVTIGDQSAGKSSAIAAISGITVPRKAGMCTRCPTHINLKRAKTRDAPWTCTVSLEKNYCRPMGLWEKQHGNNLIPLARVTSPVDLERLLERAQLASLNPNKDPEFLMSCSDSQLLGIRNDVELSPNLVRLDIVGPNCPDLTFYDLPGIFNQTADREQLHLVAEIRTMVEGYIKPEAHIILLACAMENDIEISSASSLVNTLNANDRCIGLLTKADRLPEGKPTDSWRDTLAGSNFKLGYGYFVTKQPSQVELDRGITHDEARQREEQFFEKNCPWSTEFRKFSDRFGIQRLQAMLSHLLVTRIKASLPHLKSQIWSRLDELNSRLSSLPVPPGNRSASIVSKIMVDFQSRLELQMKGELGFHQFMNKWLKVVADDFRSDLFNMRPTLVISSLEEKEERSRLKAQKSFSDSQSATQSHEVYEIGDSDNDVPATPTPSNRKRQPSAQLSASQAKKSKSTPSSSFSHTSKPTARTLFVKSEISSNPVDYIDLYTNLPFTGPTNPLQFGIEQVRDVRQKMNTSAVVDVNDHRADEFLVRQVLKRWDEPLDKFIKKTTAMLQLLLKETCSELLKDWTSTPLSAQMPSFIENFVKGVAARHRETAFHYLLAERLQPASLNDESMRQNVAQETKIFTDSRRKAIAGLYLDNVEAKTGNFTSGAEREKKIKQVKDDDLGQDEFAGEVKAMGWVRGYYNVASANFVDTMIKYMRLDIFEYTRLHLKDALEEHFGIHTEQGFQHCKILLTEDPKREEERQEYEREKEKFEQAEAKLAALDAPASEDDETLCA